jgi:hypothetical protein
MKIEISYLLEEEGSLEGVDAELLIVKHLFIVLISRRWSTVDNGVLVFNFVSGYLLYLVICNDILVCTCAMIRVVVGVWGVRICSGNEFSRNFPTVAIQEIKQCTQI